MQVKLNFVVITNHHVFRFWKCKLTKTEIGEKKLKKKIISSYEWIEWDMLRKDHKSVIEIPGSSVFCSRLIIKTILDLRK